MFGSLLPGGEVGGTQALPFSLPAVDGKERERERERVGLGLARTQLGLDLSGLRPSPMDQADGQGQLPQPAAWARPTAPANGLTIRPMGTARSMLDVQWDFEELV